MAITATKMFVGGIAGICILIMIIIFPLSFSTLEYHEYGLQKGRTTGQINSDAGVYGPGGRYMTGPTNVFQTYRAASHVIEKKNISVVSADKLETNLDIVAVYFIRKDDLPKLQKDFNLVYETVVQSRMLSAIKNAAVNFTTTQYFQSFQDVQEAFLESIKRAVEASVYVDVPTFYITGLRIPDLVSKKQLQSSIQTQINAKQLYDNQAADIRKKTETEVNDITNNATLTRQLATARASAKINIATSQATSSVERSRILALRHMFASLKISKGKEKKEIDYLMGLLDNSDVKLRVNYQPTLTTPV